MLRVAVPEEARLRILYIEIACRVHGAIIQSLLIRYMIRYYHAIGDQIKCHESLRTGRSIESIAVDKDSSLSTAYS